MHQEKEFSSNIKARMMDIWFAIALVGYLGIIYKALILGSSLIPTFITLAWWFQVLLCIYLSRHVVTSKYSRQIVKRIFFIALLFFGGFIFYYLLIYRKSIFTDVQNA